MTNDKESVFLQCFGALEDPRMDRQKKHNLLDIIAITVCAVIAGADGWVDIELFGKSKEAWLRTFLDLPHGIPSHDTLRHNHTSQSRPDGAGGEPGSGEE